MNRDHVSTAHARPLSRQVDLNLLELFELVYRTRNLTRAGVQLGLTQSAVSRGLARLREMYGDPLFVRQQRGVLPTPFADSLASPVASALDTLRATLARPVFDPAVATRSFRLAMSDVGERIFLPRLLDHLSALAPRVCIEVLSPTDELLQDGLASGQIDLAVGFLGTLSKQVRHRRLFRERFVYVVRKGHPSVKGALSRDQLKALAHVIGGPQGMQHGAALEKALSGKRVDARIALRVHSLLCIAPVVAESDLIGLMPGNLAAVVAENVPVQVLEPPMPVPGFDVTLAWHERFHRDSGHRWLRDTFSTLFEGLQLGR